MKRLGPAIVAGAAFGAAAVAIEKLVARSRRRGARAGGQGLLSARDRHVAGPRARRARRTVDAGGPVGPG
jgi:hypothetical protein